MIFCFFFYFNSLHNNSPLSKFQILRVIHLHNRICIERWHVCRYAFNLKKTSVYNLRVKLPLASWLLVVTHPSNPPLPKSHLETGPRYHHFNLYTDILTWSNCFGPTPFYGVINFINILLIINEFCLFSIYYVRVLYSTVLIKFNNKNIADFMVLIYSQSCELVIPLSLLEIKKYIFVWNVESHIIQKRNNHIRFVVKWNTAYKFLLIQ